MKYLATCKLGLESVVSRELRMLGIHVEKVEDARVEFSGGWDALCRANLWLRAAERILLIVGSFDADNFEALYEGTKALEWAEFIGRDNEVHVKGKTARSKLFSVSDCQSIVKKAIVDQLCARYGLTRLPETAGKIIVEVGMLNNIATLTLDASGVGLSRRGYRLLCSEAPLSESLAAGIVILSRHEPPQPLIDPMCGSGTFPIEAAMIAQNIAPGLNRIFAAEAWPFLPKEDWDNAREEAVQARKNLPVDIFASDIDPEAVRISKLNAARAGVDIKFEVRPVQKLEIHSSGGVMLCNPPYGERLMDHKKAEELYREIGNIFRSLDGWSVHVLSSHPEFERYYGRRADKRRNLSNGGIKCQLFQYFAKREDKGKT